jgi:hypothetical protein
MAKGILYVETHADPSQVAAYHEWYNNAHLTEVCKLDGIVSARRFEALDDDGTTFIAIYEIDADNIEDARDAVFAFMKSGNMSMPVGMDVTKAPVTKFFRQIAAHP